MKSMKSPKINHPNQIKFTSNTKNLDREIQELERHQELQRRARRRQHALKELSEILHNEV